MLVDLHVHSSASFDCDVDPRRVADRCRKLGLGPIFLTDHDSIAGAEQLRNEMPEGSVVVGQEIMTTRGEIIGLFLKEKVPANLEPREAIEAIKAQGGLVYLEHPCDSFRRHLAAESIEELADLIDVVEIHNARSVPADNRQARELALTLGLPGGVGSDAHRLADIGAVYVDIEPFKGASDFLTKLPLAHLVTSPLPHWIGVARTHLAEVFGRRRWGP